jgi:hypothetical protein
MGEMYNMRKSVFLAVLCFCFSVSQILYAEIKTFQLEKDNTINIDIPPQWGARQERGTRVPGMEKTFDIKIIPPQSEKVFFIITVGKPRNGTSLTVPQFIALAEGRVYHMLPDSVEGSADWKELHPGNGYAIYCILTDKSLVDKTPVPDDEYVYIALCFSNYNNGNIVYATILTDDINNASFRLMLNILSSISFD